MVANMSDEEIWRLNRGGHDPRKVYAAYAAAMAHKGQPTVILAKTVKGFGLGKGGEGQMVAHQQKKLSDGGPARCSATASTSRSRTRTWAAAVPKPPDEATEETRYLQEQRAALGRLPAGRRRTAPALTIPPLEAFAPILEGTGEREISTTMAFVRILTVLLKDKNIGKNIVPIVPDEARTFGMEGLFRQIGIYSSVGQLYTPQDAETLMSYREDKKGQMLEEGINEAGALCSWIAAGTAYSNHGINMVPFYIFYSMFGFQRVGDFIWAAGDIQARGFLLGATAGRTTLAGEGLQHQDGHSQLVASTVPNCVAYDPAYAYELAVIIHDGMRRMFAEQESIFYYITVMNENYAQPALPAGSEEGILRGRLPAAEGRPRQGARDAAGFRHHPARGARRGEDPGERLQDPGGRGLHHQLQRTAPRGAGMRALELLHPGEARARAVRAEAAEGARGAADRRDRLHARGAGPDPPVGAGALRVPGHGRLRPLRLARRAAPALRGGPQLHRGRGPQGAGRRRPRRPGDREPGHQGPGRRSRQARPLESLKRTVA